LLNLPNRRRIEIQTARQLTLRDSKLPPLCRHDFDEADELRRLDGA
jgi:hypothetical protein